MTNKKSLEFSRLVCNKIKYYVYCLTEPGKTKPFYVGKGKGNRVFQHAKGKIKSKTKSEKIDIIKSIVKRGEQVRCQILRHDLNKTVASEIESTLIDYIGLPNLSNKVRGHGSKDKGKMTDNQIITRYEFKRFKEKEIDDPIIVININKKFEYDMSAKKLYEATRSSWVVGKAKRNKVKYALSTYGGIVWGVYTIKEWRKKLDKNGKERWEFEGEPAKGKIEKWCLKYLPKKYFKKGAQNPIKYINC